MTWAKLDDRFHAHPEIERAGLAATGLYAMSLSYAACYETDGQLPDEWVRKRSRPGIPGRLVELGLWERIDGGYLIPDFLDYNPSRADLTAQRERDRRRKRDGILTESKRTRVGSGTGTGSKDASRERSKGATVSQLHPREPGPAAA